MYKAHQADNSRVSALNKALNFTYSNCVFHELFFLLRGATAQCGLTKIRAGGGGEETLYEVLCTSIIVSP
jgi:hypothetical protein